jgi:tight adherence protein C
MDPKQVALLSGLLWALCVALLAWLALRRMTDFKLERRPVKAKLPLFFRVFLPFANSASRLLPRGSLERTRSRADSRLVQGGLDQAISAEEFLGLRLVYLFFFVPCGLVCLLVGTRVFTAFGLFLIAYGLLYPTFWLITHIRERHRSIQRALPNVLDLLTLSVEAGRDFLTALKDILQNRPNDPLGDELERVFREVQLGKQRRQALRNMADRVRQTDLTAVVETLVQADELGVSIGHILRILGDQMRQKRFQHAEKLANESPTKLLFPLFVFIFPAVLIVMLGPVLMRTLGRFL